MRENETVLIGACQHQNMGTVSINSVSEPSLGSTVSTFTAYVLLDSVSELFQLQVSMTTNCIACIMKPCACGPT